MNGCKALMRLKFEVFLLWLDRTENFEVYKPLIEAEEVTRINTNMNHEMFQQVSWKFERIINIFDPFHKLTSNKEEYGLDSFWNPYLEMVQTLCDFCKAIQIGDWDLHLQSSEKMLAWFHAYDHFNYARHFLYYWASQQALQDSHTQMYELFQRDDSSVRRTIGNLNKISPDQVIEQTINKDQKRSGE